MRCLITGAAGFVGSHMIEYFLSLPEIEVFGADRWYTKKDNISHLMSRFHYLEFDMTDYSSVLQLLSIVKPDKIFHLASQSFVPTSLAAPAETLKTNILGQLNILEAIRHIHINPWVQVAGSSEEYGMVYPGEVPIKETNQLRPLSPYAVSKVGQDLMGYQYYHSYDLKIVRTRAFNHIGPRQGDRFVTSSFAKQIAEIEKGKREPVIYVGNLEARRDFTDVRDIVRAYWLATEECEPGEVYNICSGNCRSMRNVLDAILEASTRIGDIVISKDPAKFRPSDLPLVLGDNSKFAGKTGWEPVIPFKETIKELLDYWRSSV